MLKSTIETAIKNYVPKATITAALKKFSESPGATTHQIHECRLYRRVYVVISTYATNIQYTRSHINIAFRKHNAEQIRTRHMFTERGVIDAVARPGITETTIDDDVTADAIDCGADDVSIFDMAKQQVTFVCQPMRLGVVRCALERRGYQVEGCEWVFDTDNRVDLSEAEQADYDKFVERLTTIDGFDSVYDNVGQEEEREEKV